MKRKNIDYDNTIHKKICYPLIGLEKYKKDKEVDKSFNKRKNIFDKIDNNKKIKTYNQEHEDHEDYNCYDFDINYNRFYNGNISYENYIK
jgi:hypothetical protein